MSQPYTTDEVIYLAFHAGWGREAIRRVPAGVFADWCRDQGYERFADRLDRYAMARDALRDRRRSVAAFGTSLWCGEMEHELRRETGVA